MSDRVEDLVVPRFSVGEDEEPPYEDAVSLSTNDASCQVDLLVDRLRTTCVDDIHYQSTADIDLSRLQSDPCYCRQQTDGQLLALLKARKIKASQLEKILDDDIRAVHIRRLYLCSISGNKKASTTSAVQNIPYVNYDYSYVSNSCCENVIGYVPLPLGYAGPLLVNGQPYFVPLATTEGCLVASTNRGCRAIMESGYGVTSLVFEDGMSRAPVLRFQTAAEAISLKSWLDKVDNFRVCKQTFDSTSRFVQLQSIKTQPVGRYLYLRFVARTGDAMGMNMVSKATEATLHMLSREYGNTTHPFDVVSLSGNYCVDKKPAAINLIEGRGKSVLAETIIKGSVIRSMLHSSVDALIDVNYTKHIGSSMAGSIGGHNAHAANIVTAVFIATGQDVAQNVSSSNCMTLLEPRPNADGTDVDLHMSCTMNSMEVGTIGGGTILPAQNACLQMLGCAGASSEPGSHARQLASVICATVLAAELSLLASLTSGDLVKSHIKLNRSQLNLRSPSSSTMRPCESESFTLATASMSSSSLKNASTKAIKAYFDPNACQHIL